MEEKENIYNYISIIYMPELPVKEINETPSWHFTIPSWICTGLQGILFPEKLHTHHGKYEDDN